MPGTAPQDTTPVAARLATCRGNTFGPAIRFARRTLAGEKSVPCTRHKALHLSLGARFVNPWHVQGLNPPLVRDVQSTATLLQGASQHRSSGGPRFRRVGPRSPARTSSGRFCRADRGSRPDGSEVLVVGAESHLSLNNENMCSLAQETLSRRLVGERSKPWEAREASGDVARLWLGVSAGGRGRVPRWRWRWRRRRRWAGRRRPG